MPGIDEKERGLTVGFFDFCHRNCILHLNHLLGVSNPTRLAVASRLLDGITSLVLPSLLGSVKILLHKVGGPERPAQSGRRSVHAVEKNTRLKVCQTALCL